MGEPAFLPDPGGLAYALYRLPAQFPSFQLVVIMRNTILITETSREKRKHKLISLETFQKQITSLLALQQY